MKTKILFLSSLILFLQFIFSISVIAEPSITIYAASSLTGPLKEIISLFEKECSCQVKTNFASSGNLARQIDQGAPADIYISASQKWMKHAIENKSVLSESIIYPVKNSLVLISPKETALLFVNFDKSLKLIDSFNGRFSIGDPAHVPAGQYAKQSLESLGWWIDIEPLLIKAKDVRQALLIVESGEVELGIVFGSDAATSNKVQVVATFPEKSHQPIIYSAALCQQKKTSDIARQFLKFLITDTAQDIFINYGFTKMEEQ